MNSSIFVGWLPTIYQMKVRYQTAQQLIIINWLAQEAMPYHYVAKYPILHGIKGWRNRECYEYIRSYDWTARMYER